jgi:hypothetical protein
MDEVSILQAKISAMGHQIANGDSDMTEPTIEAKSILQSYLEMNKTEFELIPSDADISVLTREASNLLMKQFVEVNILTQANDFTGGPVNFLAEVEAELAKVPNA